GRISTLVSQARRASLAVSQQADRSFANRALDKARVTVKESELRARYQRIAEMNRELHTNGLTEEAIGLSFPEGRTIPTERRILNIFLEDWEAKLASIFRESRGEESGRQIRVSVEG